MDRAYRPFVPSKQNASRPDDGYIAGALVEAKRLAEFEMWRQGDPQLETAGAAGVAAPGCAADGLPLTGVAVAAWLKIFDIRLLSKPIISTSYVLLVYCDFKV